MRRLYVPVLFLSAVMRAACMEADAAQFRCGASETVITRVKDREEVYQDLYARALVIAHETQRMAIVTLDLGTIQHDFAESVIETVREASGIPERNTILCPSQTHNAPGVDGRHLSAESRKWLSGAIVDLVTTAAADLQPATLRVGRAPAQIGYNRRLMTKSGGLGPGTAEGSVNGITLAVSWSRQAYDRGRRSPLEAAPLQDLYRDQCEARPSDGDAIRVKLSGLKPKKTYELRWYHYNADLWPEDWSRVACYEDADANGWDRDDALLFETGNIDHRQDPLVVGFTDFSVAADAAGEIHLTTGPHGGGDSYQVLNGFEALGKDSPARFDLDVESGPTQDGYASCHGTQVAMGVNPEGPIVPWVDVLCAKGTDGKKIAVLFSHAAHPVIVHWSSEAIGPDFPGYAVKHLEKLTAAGDEANCVFMFVQGGCGNVNGYPLRGGLAACDAAGLSLAVAVTRALEDDNAVIPGLLRSRDMTLSLPRRDPPSPAACRKVLDQDPDNRRYQALLKIAESGEPQVLEISMRALAIGEDLCILTTTGEMFAEYQLFVDEVSTFKHTLFFNHVNGISSYVATRDDYELGPAGGYEAWGLPTRGPPWLPPAQSTEQLVRDGIVRLLAELKADSR